jgi:hypothetical protein
MQIKRFNSLHWCALDLTICLLFTVIPLVTNLPYRVNIFLSWEGAYRLYIGQMPFRDFGLPMGFGYWILPALFFKMFGPTFTSLIITQFVLNLVGFFSLRGILMKLDVRPLLVTLSLFVFCLTYIIYNFWPWYNNSVVIFEFVSIWLLLKCLCEVPSRFSMGYIPLSASTAFLSFFTKQDVGLVCLVICLSILIYDWLNSKTVTPLVVFILSYAAVAAIFITPFLKYEFTYWFNLGQYPHNSRITIMKLMETLLVSSFAEKLYLGIFCLILVAKGKTGLTNLLNTPKQLVLTFLCIALIGQAIATRVSSPLPTDHMTYFHVLGFVLLVTSWEWFRSFEDVRSALAVSSIIVVIHSAGYWGYAGRFMGSMQLKHNETKTVASPKSKWVPSGLPGFDKVLMPEETVVGIKAIMDCGPFAKNVRVLNMSELTPLAVTLPYQPIENQPLWFHLNIGIFQKQVDTLCARVKRNEYDLVLFEDIPDLTEFYPYQVRDTLRKYYYLEHQFLAPRKLENSVIEVYSRK